MADYIYSIANDTANATVSELKLDEEIRDSAIITALDFISSSLDVLTVTFKAALSGGDATILDGLVAAHDGQAPVTVDKN